MKQFSLSRKRAYTRGVCSRCEGLRSVVVEENEVLVRTVRRLLLQVDLQFSEVFYCTIVQVSAFEVMSSVVLAFESCLADLGEVKTCGALAVSMFHPALHVRKCWVPSSTPKRGLGHFFRRVTLGISGNFRHVHGVVLSEYDVVREVVREEPQAWVRSLTHGLKEELPKPIRDLILSVRLGFRCPVDTRLPEDVAVVHHVAG